MSSIYEDHVKTRLWGMPFDVRIVGAGKNVTPGELPKKFLKEALGNTETAVSFYRRCLDWDRLFCGGDGEGVARLGLLVNMGTRRTRPQVAAALRCRELRNSLESQGEPDRLWIDLDFTFSNSGASK